MIRPARQVFDSVQARGFQLEQMKQWRVSQHFTWAEVFTGRSLLHVKQAPLIIFENAAERQAPLMERIRAYLREHLDEDAVIRVTSWYRPPEVNQAIKGAASKSLHLRALATDFVVPGYESTAGNKKVQAVLLPQYKAMGFALEITNGSWTHADSRLEPIIFERKPNWTYVTWDERLIKHFLHAHGVNREGVN